MVELLAAVVVIVTGFLLINSLENKIVRSNERIADLESEVQSLQEDVNIRLDLLEADQIKKNE